MFHLISCARLAYFMAPRPWLPWPRLVSHHSDKKFQLIKRVRSGMGRGTAAYRNDLDKLLRFSLSVGCFAFLGCVASCLAYGHSLSFLFFIVIAHDVFLFFLKNTLHAST